MMQNELGRHMAMIEQSIARAFVADGLGVHLLGGTQGPHTLTFALRLYQPTKANIAKALKLAGAVEAAVVDSPVRIYSEQGAIFVEVPSPEPVTIYGHTLHGQGLAIPLGMTARRTIAGVDFESSPHVLLVGPTGRGKTTAARAIAYHLARQNPARQVRFIVSTFKPKDWAAFNTLAHTFAVITDPDESKQAIVWVKEVMHRRAAEGNDSPHLFVFLDDLLNLLAVTDIVDDLAQLVSLGRAAGVHLIIGTQRLGKRGAGDAAITGNIPARLVFGTADAQDAAMFAGRGESGAEKLGRYPGDALLVTDGSTQRLAVAYVNDGDLAALRQDASDWRPWGTTRTGSNDGARNAENPQKTPHFSEPVLTGSTPVPGGSEVVLAGPARTARDRQLVLDAYARTGSKNQTAKAIWGYKNGETWRWLNEALEGVAQ